MFKEIMETPPIPYRLHDIGLTDRPYSQGGLLIQYHPWLHATDYQESIDLLLGIWVIPYETAPSGYAIHVLGRLQTVRWPGWGSAIWRYDAYSGAFLGRSTTSLSIWAYEMSVTRQGELFYRDHWNWVKRVDPITFAHTGEQYSGYYWHDGADTGTGQTAWVFDRATDRAVVVVSGIANQPDSTVGIFQWSTGQRLKVIDIAGITESIYFADKDCCHIVATNGVITVLNYTTEKVLGVARHTQRPDKPANKQTRYFFDSWHRRILASDHTPDDPVTGASTITVRGYIPIPLTTHLTVPIPLKVPRPNQATPVLTRAIGDASESLAGIRVSQTMIGSGALTPSSTPTDIYGYAHFNSTSDAPATTQDVTVSTEV